MGGLSECNFKRVYFDLHVALISCIIIDSYTHFSIFIVLRLVQYLFKFLGYKKLPYTKLTQILLGFCRTWPFCYSCFRTRVTASKASPLLFLSPLKMVVPPLKRWQFWNILFLWCHVWKKKQCHALKSKHTISLFAHSNYMIMFWM